MNKDDEKNYNSDMNEMMKFIKNSNYENKLVAFVDIMGMKNKILNSKKPDDFIMYNIILYMIKKQPFCFEKLQFLSFSDCMYIIADKGNEYELLLSLSLLSYYMLFDSSLKISNENTNECKGIKIVDCYKVRGGVTFGKVLSIPQNNIILGKATIEAYHLENDIAVYPRIIFDEYAINIIKETKYFNYIEQDDNDSVYYLDFIKLISAEARFIAKDLKYIDKIIEFVEEECKKTVELKKKLEWYINYLKKHKKTGEENGDSNQ